MSLLVRELESLEKDGAWQRAALPGKFIPPELEKCPDRTREPSGLHGFSGSESLLLCDFSMAQSREGFQPRFV